MPTLRTTAMLAPLALLAVAAADAPQTRAGQYRNVTTIAGERYVVNECRPATPITTEAAEGSCKAARSRIGGGVIDVALVCGGGKSKTIAGTYTPNGFSMRTVGKGYGAGTTVSQTISTRTGDCTPEE